ncbi:MAG: hypothetical protein FJ106_01850 [Deltaproteobacteria bacterium]|nr:hypothetical protein [Deltaproteobacteria bacterium]
MPIKINSFLKDQSGVALVVALIIMIVLTLIGLAATFTSTFEIMLSGQKRGSTDAFYAADGGIQAILANRANFPVDIAVSNYTLIPNSGGLPADLQNEPIDRQLTTPVLSLPSGVNFTTSPQVTIYHSSITTGGEGTQGYISDTYLIDSTGRDQIGTGPSRSTVQLREKWVMRRPAED